MDGSNWTLIANLTGSDSYGLTIDYIRQELYWTDYSYRKIERCNVDGTNRQLIEVEDTRYPFGIVFFEDALYFTGLNLSNHWQVKRIPREGGVSTTILSGLSGSFGIQVVANQAQNLGE